MRPSRGDGYLTTNEAARLAGVAPGTIRSWASAKRGHLAPSGMDERGWPLYAPESVREAERKVRERGLATSGIDPRQLRRREVA
jgi:DNA-binding transcriptional MerR regulator